DEVAVAGEDGGEADGGAGGDIDCDEREFDVVVYRKEHRRGVLRPGVAQSLRRRGLDSQGCRCIVIITQQARWESCEVHRK
ncbi:hypothetical protein V490_08308, partial [Pseudogymnoascus sp. VKM F-3557]